MAVAAAAILAKRPKVAHPGSVFTVFVLAGLIALATVILYNELREGVFLGLLVFLIIGSLWPPGAIVLGLVMLSAILLRGAGVKIAAWLGGLVQKQGVSGSAGAFGPIAKSVPGYQPPTSSAPFAPIAKSVPGG